MNIPTSAVPRGAFQFGTGGHYAQFSAAGHLTFVGDARPWRDQILDSLSLRSQGPGVSANITENTSEFATNSDLNDYLYGNIQLNHDKDLASDLHMHVHLFQALNAKPNILIRYRWQINGGAKTTSWSDLPLTTYAFTYTSGTLNQIIYGAAITPPIGTALSDIVQFRIFRDNSNASLAFSGVDGYGAAVGIISVDTHFMLNSAGSDQEYIK